MSGNLGKDLELKYSQSGMAIATTSMCFKSGKDQDSWINIVIFNKLAESMSNILKKGDRILIDGYLSEQTWVDKEGNNKRKMQLIANIIEFIKVGGSGTNPNQQNDNQSQGQKSNPEQNKPKQQQQQQKQAPITGSLFDDMPF